MIGQVTITGTNRSGKIIVSERHPSSLSKPEKPQAPVFRQPFVRSAARGTLLPEGKNRRLRTAVGVSICIPL